MQLKNLQRPEQTFFFPKKYSDGPQIHEVLNINNYQKNANQNYKNGCYEKTKCQQELGEKGTLLHCWWECKLVQPLQKTIWRFLGKFKLNSIWPSNCTSAYISKGNEIITLKRYWHPCVQCGIIYNSQDVET